VTDVTASESLPAASAPTGGFARKATGLVREVSGTDALIMNTIGMNLGVGAVFLFLQAPANFPRGSMLVATIVGTVLMAFTLLWVYSEFAASMPRSGGDYVFVSRALHPFVGWLMSWSQGIWLIFFWVGFNAWFALTFAIPVAFSTIGAASGHPGWITLSNDLLAKHTVLGMHAQWWVILFGALITIAFGVLLAVGARRYWRYQKVAFAFAGGSILLLFILLIFRGGSVPGAWNHFAAHGHGLSYDKIIPTAKAKGFDDSGGFSLSQTLLMLPWVFFVVGYAQGSAQIGGEVKQARRNQYRAMVGGVLINGLVLALLVIVFQAAVGRHWIGSLAFLSGNAPDQLGLPGSALPGVNLVASLLTSNVILLAIIGIGFVMWAVNGTPLSELQATRYMLAWSVDRTVPPQLGEVNERFHTPIRAIVLSTFTGIAAVVVLTVNSNASLLGALLAQILAFIVVSAAGVVFPYRLREVWEAGGGRRILGVPAVTLAGIGGVASLVALLCLFLFNHSINTTFAATRHLSLYFMGGVIAAGTLWYLGAWLYHRSRGVSLALAYREIPPE
jgi:amino acid transporter